MPAPDARSGRAPRRSPPLALVLLVSGLLGLGIRGAESSSPGDGPFRSEGSLPDSVEVYRSYTQTYASEDTLPIYVYGETIEVSATRMSLAEIIALCMEAEKNKYDGVEDVQFTTMEKAVLTFGDLDDPDARREVEEEISRTYIRRDGEMVNVPLHAESYVLVRDDAGTLIREPKDDDEDDGLEVRVGTASDALVDIPFFFEQLDDYHFDIRERRHADGRVLYRIAFVPRSDYAPLPTGEFWIDTNDFQIFHLDLTFMDNVPVPMILKGVDFFSIEKRRFRDTWVYDRISGRVRLRKVPFVPMPQTVEFLVQFDDYVMNQGLTPEDLGGSE
jgi:hypothetical protein